MSYREIYQEISKKIGSIKNGTILELGCHWGEDTERIISWFKGDSLNFFSFEPDPRNIDIINRNSIRWKNNHKVNWRLIEGAVYKEEGEMDLYLSDGRHPVNGNKMTGANSIRKPKEVLNRHNWIDFNKKIKVKTYTIDDFCQSNNIEKIDFIWSDIQGCEMDMLKGASKIITNTGMMLLEYSDTELYQGQGSLTEMLNFLGKNWRVMYKTNIDVLVINDKYLN